MMPRVRDGTEARTLLRSLLDRVESASPVQAVEVVADELAALFGAREVSFLISDFSGRAVFRMGRAVTSRSGTRFPGAEQVRLPGTVYERVLVSQEVDVRETGDGARLTIPVTNRGDAIGLLQLDLPHVPDEDVVADVATAGHALAYVVVANRRHTDLFEWGQRSTPFSLAAEIQRRLLPGAFTCEAGQFTVAGWLEPASSVAGDTFDYTLDQHALQVSITDAVGHDVAAAMLATVLVSGLRNERRRGVGLGEQVRGANDALVAHSSVGQFVTGQVLHVDLETGAATIVNAGHPFPLRLRDGRVEEVELEIDLPFGLEEGADFRLARTSGCSGSRWSPVTGSCSSPTGCWSAAPSGPTCGPGWRAPAGCTPGRSCSPWATPSWTRRGATCATTRRSSAWTGTAARRGRG
jgi:hypothetical protein